GDRKPESAPAEGLRNRGRQYEPAQHQKEQQDADRRKLRIEPVGDPGSVDPNPPYAEQQQGGLDGAEQGEMRKQGMRYLRHREHEHQIEQQFGVSDPAMLVRYDRAK